MRVWIEGRVGEEEVDAIVEILREQGIRVVSFDGEEIKNGEDIWWGAGAGILNSWIVVKVEPPKVVDVIKKRGWRLCLWKNRRSLMYALTGVALGSHTSCKLYKKIEKEYRYKIEGVVDIDILKLLSNIDDIEVVRPYNDYWFGGTVIPEVMVERLYPVFGGVGFGKGIVSNKMVARIIRHGKGGELEIYDAVKAAKILCRDGDEEALRLARVVTGLPVKRCSELSEIRYRGFMWRVMIRLGATDVVNSYEVALAGMIDSMKA
ncbi:MAG: hypothetical protein C0179_04565 [Fervidicoccus sp.]|nr:MAG: hypothetical protein C0179_04565 [Fervidicoccus sp.]